jgi:general secretion pathway protein D
VVLPGGRAAGGSAYGGIPGPPPIFKEEVRIVADEVTNSLVFLAMKQDFEKILEILKEIDVVPRQVVIEVMIAEVTLDKDLEFGVDHAVRFAKVLGEDNLKDSVSSVRPSGGGKVGEDSTIKDAILALATPGAGGMAALITDKDNFAILIRALASRSLVKILSAPHIIAADNREAHIQVGESIPILTSTSQSTLTATSNIVNQVQYRDTGTILTILPQVNSAGLVNMQVSQEVSAVSERKIEGIDSPAFLTRSAETTIVVQDGDSVLIGGIMDEQRTTQRSGVPFIMDIPVFGRFFRFEKASVKKTELLVLITPYVIRSREEALSVTDDFKKVIHGLDQMLEHREKRRRPDGEGNEPRTEGQKPL